MGWDTFMPLAKTAAVEVKAAIWGGDRFDTAIELNL
jgi:hypothetical protein